jgi:hypothetical protein
MGKTVIPNGKGTLKLVDGADIKGEFINGKIDVNKQVEMINIIDCIKNVNLCEKYCLEHVLNEQSCYGQNSVNRVFFKYKGKINEKYQFCNASNDATITICFYEEDDEDAEIIYTLDYKGKFSDNDIYCGTLEADEMMLSGEEVYNVSYKGEFCDYLFAGEGEIKYKCGDPRSKLYGLKVTKKNLQYDDDKYISKYTTYESECAKIDITYENEDRVNIKFNSSNRDVNDIFKLYYNVSYNGKLEDGYRLVDGKLEMISIKDKKIQTIIIKESNNEQYAYIRNNRILVLDGKFERYFDNNTNELDEVVWGYGYTTEEKNLNIEICRYLIDFAEKNEEGFLGLLFGGIIGGIPGIGVPVGTGLIGAGKNYLLQFITGCVSKEGDILSKTLINEIKGVTKKKSNKKIYSNLIKTFKIFILAKLNKNKDEYEDMCRLRIRLHKYNPEKDKKTIYKIQIKYFDKISDDIKSFLGSIKKYQENEVKKKLKISIGPLFKFGNELLNYTNDVENILKNDNLYDIEKSLEDINKAYDMFFKEVQEIVDKIEDLEM